MTKRLFIAIPISEELRQFFVGYSKDYQLPEIRWLPAENLHITLNFLGATDEKMISRISEKLKKITADVGPFVLKFNKILFGPPQGTPRLVWAEYLNCPEYNKLINRIVKVTYGDFRHRETHPHITLARFRNWRAVQHLKFKQPENKKMALEVKEVLLMESELRREGAVYGIVERFELVDK